MNIEGDGVNVDIACISHPCCLSSAKVSLNGCELAFEYAYVLGIFLRRVFLVRKFSA